MNAKAGEYRCSELRGLDVSISARYHWSVQDNWPLFHYVIGISGILPYNRNVTLHALELFSAYARLYNAAASPASRLHSAGSLAMTYCSHLLRIKKTFTCFIIFSVTWQFSINDVTTRVLGNGACLHLESLKRFWFNLLRITIKL